MKKKSNGNANSKNDRVIVALDTPSLDIVKKILKELDGVINYYKIGFELFTAHGWTAVDLVRKHGAKIFLDLKLHDIPNTVAKTAAVICEHEIEMFNVHTLGGYEMMKHVREVVDQRAKSEGEKPIILGVTILTSHAEEELSRDLGIQKPLKEEVVHLAKLAEKAGLDGVVASARETVVLRDEVAKDFLIVTPGIRPTGSAKGDQKRTLGPAEAFQAGADYIVVGRPITDAPKPREQAEAIVRSL